VRLDPERWVPLAEIARPHGVRGELRLKLFNASSDVLLEQDEVLVKLPDGEEHEVSVDKARRADDAILMKLHSVDDRNRADELRGAQVCVRRKDFPPLEEGEHYSIDLVGAEAQVDGIRIGAVIDVVAYPTVDVLVISDEKQIWEIPMTEAYLGVVDADAGVIEVKTLDELEATPVRKPKGASPAAPPGPASPPKPIPKWKQAKLAKKAAATSAKPAEAKPTDTKPKDA
jgi:16S rRNA processing protein RimM